VQICPLKSKEWAKVSRHSTTTTTNAAKDMKEERGSFRLMCQKFDFGWPKMCAKKAKVKKWCQMLLILSNHNNFLH
jgi:hypothetical protein